MPETLYVTAPTVEVYSDKGAFADIVCDAHPGAALTVIDREENWLKISLPVGSVIKQGYVFNEALSNDPPPASNAPIGVSGSAQITMANAPKGFDQNVENYSQTKNFDKKALLRMLSFRNTVTAADFLDFAKKGKVGIAR